MNPTASATPHRHAVMCVACARHMRPEMVPWLQHAIGCPVRTAELSRVHSLRVAPMQARPAAAAGAPA